MKTASLRLRLLFAAAASFTVTLGLVGICLIWLFEKHVIEGAASDLQHHLNQLAAVFTLDENGSPILDAGLTDPRFDGPFSGLYWQIEEDGKPVLRSRSLWDSHISLAAGNGSSGRDGILDADGPGSAELLIASKTVTYRDPKDRSKRKHFQLIIGLDKTAFAASRAGLMGNLVIGLGLLAVTLVVATWMQVSIGLRPLTLLRDRLAGVRRGEQEELEGDFPAEVIPLVTELNNLISSKRTAVIRARARAADLAHGLKTPLTAVSAHCDRLAQRGEGEIAQAIEVHIDMMRRHVERALALARSQGSQLQTNAMVSIRTEIERTVDVIKRLPSEKELQWRIEADQAIHAAMDPEDFTEIMGNILDNARKWARSEVTISARPCNEGVRICVLDDGPGVPEDKLDVILERGIRLDEKDKGSGLGLSIIQAILESYKIDLTIRSGGESGLDVEFVVPTKSS